MLSQPFLEWWFEPWRYAAAGGNGLAHAQDLHARRDAYRLWCVDAGVAPELPAHFDTGWCVAAGRDAASVLGAARLFAGLIAARHRDLDCLHFYTPAERKWCLAIAATQPLQSLSGLVAHSHEAIQQCGLLELAIRLEQGFPGMWSRLRLTLPVALALETSALLDEVDPEQASGQGSSARPLRCWRLCLTHADALSERN